MIGDFRGADQEEVTPGGIEDGTPVRPGGWGISGERWQVLDFQDKVAPLDMIYRGRGTGKSGDHRRVPRAAGIDDGATFHHLALAGQDIGDGYSRHAALGDQYFVHAVVIVHAGAESRGGENEGQTKAFREGDLGVMIQKAALESLGVERGETGSAFMGGEFGVARQSLCGM